MQKEDKSTPVLISGKVHPELAATFQRIVEFVGGNPNYAMSEMVKAAAKDRGFQTWLGANPVPTEPQTPPTKRTKARAQTA